LVAQRTIRSTPRDGQRGRPGSSAPPDQVLSALDGALASRVAARPARIAQQRGCLVATNDLDETQRPPQERREGDNSQGHAERGFRFLKDPRLLASSLYLNKPARLMALLMVMTVCWLVDAALESRIRHALKDHGATFPNHTGTPGQHPTARWVLGLLPRPCVILLEEGVWGGYNPPNRRISPFSRTFCFRRHGETAFRTLCFPVS
jgi:hypothetical protein